MEESDASILSLVFGGGQQQTSDAEEEIKEVGERICVEESTAVDGSDSSTLIIEKAIQQSFKHRNISGSTNDTAVTDTDSSLPCSSCPTASTSSSPRRNRVVEDPRLQIRYDHRRGGPDFKAQADSRSRIGDGRDNNRLIVRAEPMVATDTAAQPPADFYGRLVTRGRVVFDPSFHHSQQQVDLVSAVVECSPVERQAQLSSSNGSSNRPPKQSSQSEGRGNTLGRSNSWHSWWDNNHHHRQPIKKTNNSGNTANERRFWLMIISLGIFLNFLLVTGTTAMGLYLSGNMPGQNDDPDVPLPAPTLAPSPTLAPTPTIAPTPTPPPRYSYPSLPAPPPPENIDDMMNSTAIAGPAFNDTQSPTLPPSVYPSSDSPIQPTDSDSPQPKEKRGDTSLSPTSIGLLAGGTILLEAFIVALLLLLHRRWKKATVQELVCDHKEPTGGSEPATALDPTQAQGSKSADDDGSCNVI